MPLRSQSNPSNGAVAVLCLLLGLRALPAHAGLGQPEESVSAEAASSRAVDKSADHGKYRVHEIQLQSGTVLREYAVSGGNVFAVTWNGPSLPDMRQALGQYFDVYINARRLGRASHTYLEIRQDQLVIQSRGHMRAFSGRAYLPHSLPAGTAADVLR